jgi:hypothetical protein
MLDIPEAVKNLLKQDSVPKNFRISFPEGERADILNDQIIKESVQLTESLSTRNVIKFGSCDSSVLRFSCVGVEDITGMRIQARLDVNIMSLPADIVREIGQTAPDLPFAFYPVPYGEFVVDSCEYDAKMLTRKVIAYSLNADISAGLDTNVPLLEQKRRDALRTSNTTLTLNLFNYSAIMSGGAMWDLVKDHATIWDRSEETDVDSDTYYSGIINHVSFEIMFVYRHTTPAISNVLPNAAALCYLKAQNGMSHGTAAEVYDQKQAAKAWVRDLAAQSGASTDFLPVFDYVVDDSDISLPRASISSAYNVSDTFYPINYNQFYQNSHVKIPYRFVIHIHIGGEDYAKNFEIYRYDDTHEEFPLFYNHISNDWIPDAYTMSVKANKVKVGGATRYNYAQSLASISGGSILLSACELMGCFGGLDRYGNFRFYRFVKTSQIIFPADDLYPSGTVYPLGYLHPSEPNYLSNIVDIEPENYINAWHDEKPISFGRIVAYYRDANGDDVAYTQIVAENEEDYDPASLDYDLSNNAIITAGAYTSEQITTMCADLIDALRDLKYYRAEISMRGLPQVEAGDMMWVRTPNNRFVTPVLSRTLTGIQDLRDKIASK